jgi:hypothetical protein
MPPALKKKKEVPPARRRRLHGQNHVTSFFFLRQVAEEGGYMVRTRNHLPYLCILFLVDQIYTPKFDAFAP